jgi:hypothetical protein
LEEYSGSGEGNSKSSELAATIINQFAGADSQNAFTSGGYRPVTDTRSMKVTGNLPPVADTQKFILKLQFRH